MISGFYRTPGALAALSAAALLAGCKTATEMLPSVPGVTPYRMVIQQGNFISQEMVAQLKPGMTKEQVRFVLGTPLVADIFHADRWDYVFYRELPGGKREQRNLSVIFEKERLARVIGDLMPAESAAPQAGGFDSQMKPGTKPAAEAAKPAGGATAKPAAEAAAPAKPAAEAAAPAKPAAQPAAPPTQNWRAASDEPEKKPEPAPAAEEAKKAEEPKAEEPQEKSWWQRMKEKIGL